MNEIHMQSHVFNVEESEGNLWNHDALGRAHLATQQIALRKELKPDAKLGTLLHELIHMIADINSLALDETTISVLANGVQSLIVSNSYHDSYLSNVIKEASEYEGNRETT